MNDPVSLRQRFALPGLTFDEDAGLTRVHVEIPSAKATIYLQGAHLTAWRPNGFEPAIKLSQRSVFAPGKAIRGGIPIVFPWFANDSNKNRIDGHPGPSHGFARIQDWTLDNAERTPGEMLLTFTLGPTDLSRSMGYDHFLLSLSFRIGSELTLALTVTNQGEQPLTFEEAFHTYYRVSDIHMISVSGLERVSFIDKTDGMTRHAPNNAPITFTRTVDRVYNNTSAICVINDVPAGRKIVVEKSGSQSTIVWNAFAEMADLGPWDWHEYVAVETGNVGENAVTLAAHASATMQAHVLLEKSRS